MFEANIADIRACIEDDFKDRVWPEEISDQELQEVLDILNFDSEEEENYA